MFIPRDRPLHAGLSTSFVAFDALLADLAARRFSGAVEITAEDFTGVLFLVGGQPAQAVAAGDSGPTAATAIATRAAAAGGTVSVFAFEQPLAVAIAGAAGGEVLYRDLPSAFTNLDRLLERLEADGHTGSVEVAVPGTSQQGAIYFNAGLPVESLFVRDGAILSGTEAADVIVEVSASGAAAFTVIRAARFGEAPPPEATAACAPPVAAPARSSPAAAPAPGVAEVLGLWEEVIAGVEEVVDDISRPGTFLLAFKEVLVAKAEQHPFLDPFAGEFEYRAGRLTFHAPPPEGISAALGECIEDTIARLAFQLRRADLETRVRERHSGFEQRHAATIERFHLGPATQAFVA